MTLADIAEQIGGKVHGDGTIEIERVATLENAGPGDISFLSNPRYHRHLTATKAAAVILAAEHLGACPVSAVVVGDPYLAYARTVTMLNPSAEVRAEIHQAANISPDCILHATVSVGAGCVVEAGATIGRHVVLGPGCYIGTGATIGDGSRLIANVTVCHDCVIGERVQIQPGAVIGSDGFGLANDHGVWIKIPQLGRVVIGNDVEIGANTTIDRGALEDTVIGDGVKLDNQIQVAHNVRIGAHTVIAACTGISGSTRIGKRCVIGGGVGIVGHLDIADDVQITGMSFVHKSLTEAGVYSSGTPLEPTRKWRKNFVRFQKLDDLARRVRHLESLLVGIMKKEGED